MDQNRIRFLLKLYAENLATPKEVEELFNLLKTAEPDDHLKKSFVEAVIHVEPEIVLPEESWDEMWKNIHAVALQSGRKKISSYVVSRNIAAAVLIAIAGVAVFFTWNKKKTNMPVAANRVVNNKDIEPGGNKAILTLADGSTIVLDTAHNGHLANQNNTTIIKLSSGLLSYKDVKTNEEKILLNTITTPRGGQYGLELSDGTKVWLNSASSLIFPTSFTGKERRVELKGEGYFEVAKNEAMPFHVNVDNVDVKVLGTHFNIMGYNDDENINTTLIEGKVTITANETTKNLLPGKKAVFVKTTNNIEISKANIAQAVAWKNGEFRFKDTGIEEIMRQVGRWYDVDVEYQTKSTNQYFTASLPRMQNISTLLQILELTGTVHFKIDNRKIIVLP